MEKERMVGIDHLRWAIAFTVVLYHMVITYLDIMTQAEWYFHPTIKSEVLVYSSFYPFALVMHSLLMPLFFMISGYFVPVSYDKQGFSLFLKKKVKRLILPALFCYVVTQLLFHVDFLHIWFLEVLFVFCLLYAFIRKVLDVRLDESKHRELSLPILLASSLLIGVVCAAVGKVFTINTYVHYYFFNFEPARFFLYMAAFFLGVLSRRYGWFQVEKQKFLTFIVTGIVLVILLSCVSDLSNYGSLYRSRYALFESPIAILFCFVVIWTVIRYCNKSNRFFSLLTECSFGVYLFHLPISYTILVLTASWQIYFPVKFLLLTFAALVASLVFTILFRKLPFVGKYI